MSIDRLADTELIDRIYEAAALPHLWPVVLHDIANKAGAVGAAIVAHDQHRVGIIASPRLERFGHEYVAEGWASDPEHAAPLLADQYPGFRAETHYRTIEEIEKLPVHVHFLAPRGLVAGAGTVLQGARDDMMHVAIEGFPSHMAAEAAVPWLDRMRAPLARAMSLTVRLQEAKAESAVAGLELAGVGAAVVSGDGRLRAVNDLFAQRLGERLRAGGSDTPFVDRFLQAQVTMALVAPDGEAGVRSVAMDASVDQLAYAIHILPLRAGARDVFGWDGVLLLIAEAANASVPSADLLRLLFDLTPAEARLTRLLLEGATLLVAARTCGVTEATARTQLKAVFAKTGAARQTDLVRLLTGLGPPVRSSR